MNDTQREEVLRLYGGGLSLAAVSKMTGISNPRVRTAVMEAGLLRKRWDTNRKDDVTEKRCPRCKTVKPAEEFGRARRKDGSWRLHGYCARCNLEYSRLWLHGLTQADYDRMMVEQDGKCAICHEPPDPEAKHSRHRVLHVDHCHTREEVRQLLCWRCNCGLGNFGDDIERMKSAVAYLERHQGGS